MLPSGELSFQQGSSQKHVESGNIAKAEINFSWVDTDVLYHAPRAQLILYPQYPEVRMSGLLTGCRNPPSNILNTREKGRILFLGICDQNIFAYIAPADSPICKEVRERVATKHFGGEHDRLKSIPLTPREEENKTSLLQSLLKIHQHGWWPSAKLDANGNSNPYTAPNGAGYTLEAAFGIQPNGKPLPDYLGWELKASRTATASWPKLSNGARITLMTPEPSMGLYTENISLFREFYAKKSKSGHLYFTGSRAIGGKLRKDNLSLELIGIDDGLVKSSSACIILRDTYRNEIAAGWPIAPLIEHWRKKHAKTAFIAYQKSIHADIPSYLFSNIIRVAEGEDFSHFLKSFSVGHVIYDPGVKFTFENAKWTIHRRNQFRTRAENIRHLYSSCDDIDIMHNEIINFPTT